jgi:putative RNA 2'-phosphotransferase
MDHKSRVRVSKLMSLGLRHEPAALGLVLDDAGWVTVEALLAGLAAKGEAITREDVVEIVRTSDKQRFALSPDGARIRANQGHSVDVELGLAPKEPPAELLHGTSEEVLPQIRRDGLLRMARTHVHLSADEKTANVVAKRRAGATVLVRVDAAAMHRDGHAFFQAENGVWLTLAVPARYLRFP